MPRNNLRKLVKRHPEAKPTLPSIHSTDAYRLMRALDKDQLLPRPCPVFDNEPLLYFFYGRPSYRVNSDEGPTSLDHYMPACLLFKTASISPIKRIFPFDTGAFRNGLYDKAMHRDMDVEDFGLEEDVSTPGRIISLFFGSVEAYLEAKALDNLALDAAEFEAASYHALSSSKFGNEFDNRVSGVELQFEGPIQIKGNVEAVILSKTLLDSPGVKAKLKGKNIKPLVYRQIGQQKPSEYTSAIFDTCYEYYERTRLMKRK